MMGFQSKRIDVNHDLSIATAKGLRYRSSRDVGDLVTHVVLAQVSQFGFFEALTFQGDKTDGQARCIEL